MNISIRLIFTNTATTIINRVKDEMDKLKTKMMNTKGNIIIKSNETKCETIISNVKGMDSLTTKTIF